MDANNTSSSSVSNALQQDQVIEGGIELATASQTLWETRYPTMFSTQNQRGWSQRGPEGGKARQ